MVKEMTIKEREFKEKYPCKAKYEIIFGVDCLIDSKSKILHYINYNIGKFELLQVEK